MTPLFADIRKRLEARTPGEYELRCREFSNHAPVEIWTDLGWVDQLPRQYRDPTYVLFAHAPSDIETLLKALDVCVEALVEIAKPAMEAETWMETAKFRKTLAEDALKQVRELG